MTRSALKPKLQLLQSSNFTYQRFGGGQVPGAANEFALSQAVQSEASASQITQSAPCETPQEFHEYLLAPARNSFASEAVNEENLRKARKLQSLQRPGVKFTHGDIKHHNILVDEEGHMTGLLDWESAGWYPEFWEYTQHCDFCQKTFGGMSFLMKAGAQRYLEESECERALTNLTADSYSGENSTVRGKRDNLLYY
jgi:hypothetical protein